jgi:putative acetyltransferase
MVQGNFLAAIEIRPFRPDDAPSLARLFHAAIHEIAARHYSPEQILAWCPEQPDPRRFEARGADGRILFVAVDGDDRPLAYGDVEASGHIDHFFCRPDAAGTGVSAMLLAALEEAAAALGITRLFVEASEPARRFFERQGFSLLYRRDFEIAGVAIHNYAMEKQIGG